MKSLDEIIFIGENKYIEFKKVYSRTLLKTVCAFANYHTGRIFIGVNDDRALTGVDDEEQVRLSVENAINDGVYPRPYFEIKEHEVDGKKVIEIIVFKGERTPYVVNNKAYKRSDTASVEVDHIGYEELILAGRNITFETMDAESDEVTFEYLGGKLLKTLNIPCISNDILTTLEVNKNNKLNKAGWLLSDQNPILTSVVNLIKYEGKNTSVIIEREKISNCSILEQFDRVIEFFKKNIQKKEIIVSEYRKTVEDVPIVAFREAIANALVHRLCIA